MPKKGVIIYDSIFERKSRIIKSYKRKVKEMEKVLLSSSWAKAKRVLALALAFVLVFGMSATAWADGPGGGSSGGPGGGSSGGPGSGDGPGGGGFKYEYSMKPELSSYSFDYQQCIYSQNPRSGDVAIIYVTVSPALTDESKTVAFNYAGEDMEWSLAEPVTNDVSTILTFRGETNVAQDNVLDETSGKLTAVITDKTYNGEGDMPVYGKVEINISYYNSAQPHTVTINGNGGKLLVKDASGNETEKDSIDVSINGGDSFEAGYFANITPTYEYGAKIFVGWKIEGENTVYYNIPNSNPMQRSVYDIKFTEDTVLNAYWEDAVEVKYVTDRGTITEAYDENKNSAKIEGNTATFYTPKNQPTFFTVKMESDDSVLSGWVSSKGEEFKLTGTQNIAYTADETYTAVWSDAVKFTFKSAEGYIDGVASKNEKTILVPEGKRLGYGDPSTRAPFASGKEGYVVVSWVDEATGLEYTPEDFQYQREDSLYTGEDKTLIAKWELEWYFVSYVKEPTCTEPGIENQRNIVNGSYRQVQVPARGHVAVIDEGVAPTKTTGGWTTGSHCKTCGIVLKARTPIPMLKEDSSGKLSGQKDTGATGTGSGSAATQPAHANEWYNGKWYNADGTCTYTGELKWYCDSTGWWVQDTDGWYPVSQWEKIDGVWYYFNSSGYMASSEWYDGYWFNGDGSWDSAYKMTWKNNATGWWIEDITGWWPSNSWQKIDGYWYYFDGSGYMATSQYVDGYWLGADGACQ